MNFILKYIEHVFALVFFFGIFLGDKALVLSLALLIILTIFKVFSNKISFTINYYLKSLIILYLIHFISFFYSNNKANASFDLEVKLSLLIFPIVFLFSKNTFLFSRNTLIKLFIFAGFVISFIHICLSFINYFNTGGFLYYTLFSFLLHPSYYSMYLDLSIFFSIFLISKSHNIKAIIVYSVIIIFALINIYFLDSKASYISTPLIIFYFGVSYFYKKNKISTIIALIILSIGSLSIILQNPRFQESYSKITSYKKIIKSPELENSSTSLRILAWNATIEVIKENAIFGVGAGDVKDELIKKYEELNYVYLVKYKLNSHNQFLETWLGQGLVGFILLLLLFIVPFISAVKNGDIVLQSFLILVFINFLFESMLNTQAGTIFFAFFYSFLVSTSEKQSAEKVL